MTRRASNLYNLTGDMLQDRQPMQKAVRDVLDKIDEHLTHDQESILNKLSFTAPKSGEKYVLTPGQGGSNLYFSNDADGDPEHEIMDKIARNFATAIVREKHGHTNDDDVQKVLDSWKWAPQQASAAHAK